jgi:diaminopimelate epimerase
MKLRFTKMQGSGNDFVVLDATRAPIALSAAQFQRLGDRRFGVGADQILVVERSRTEGIDFRYRIFNNSGEEVEHCGNGARCFVHFVRDQGLTTKTHLTVETVNNVLELQLQADGGVTVDMNAPIFDLVDVPFDASGLTSRRLGDFELWPLDIEGSVAELAVLSMGNPHAVQIVANVDTAPVLTQGPLIQQHTRFAKGVNVGFMQIVNRGQIRLRVFERGAGETLACGTGACAAVVAGVHMGLLDTRVQVDARGGQLSIEWNRKGSGATSSVLMTGPAVKVFEGEIEL